jgi:hypothetical protein
MRLPCGKTAVTEIVTDRIPSEQDEQQKMFTSGHSCVRNRLLSFGNYQNLM